MAIAVEEDSLLLVGMEIDPALGRVRQVQGTSVLAAAVVVEDILAADTHYSLEVGLVVAGCRGLVVHLAMADLVAFPFGCAGGTVVAAVDRRAQGVLARLLVFDAC